MFTYQQQPRVLHTEAGDVPSFPTHARYELVLEPAHVLGGVAGDLPVVLPNRSLSVEWNGPTGRAVIQQDPPLEAVRLEGNLLGGEITVQGAIVTVQADCHSLAAALTKLETLRLLLPSVLSVFLPRPVTVSYARVFLGSAVLRSELRRAAYPIEVMTEDEYTDRVIYALTAADAIAEGDHPALFAAAAYMHVAERLAALGNSSPEFAAEIVLNLTKVLEALFGSSRDSIRAGLTSLNYEEAEREGIFIALVVIRNEMDVGHAKLTTYSKDVLDRIYSFVIDAPFAVKELIVRAVNATIAGTWQPPSPAAPRPRTNIGRLVSSIDAGNQARKQRIRNIVYMNLARSPREPNPPTPGRETSP